MTSQCRVVLPVGGIGIPVWTYDCRDQRLGSVRVFCYHARRCGILVGTIRGIRVDMNGSAALPYLPSAH